MVQFSLYLHYQDEVFIRLLAEGCTKEQLLNVLSSHLLLAEVQDFKIDVHVNDTPIPFKEYTL